MNKLASDNIVVLRAPEGRCLVFSGKDSEEILRLNDNGDIFLRGELIENDKQVVDGLKEFLNSQGVGAKK